MNLGKAGRGESLVEQVRWPQPRPHRAPLTPPRPTHPIHDAASAMAAANLPRGTVATLAIPGLDSASSALFESHINSALSECGCRLSAIFLVVGACAAIAIDVWAWRTVRQSPGVWLVAELGLAFLVSGVGRVIGIANARRRLRRTLRAIHDRIDNQSI